VELHRVTFGYGGSPALEDVSLRLEPGQYAALVGPSGAGKTTLLKLVLGMLQPGRGEVRVGGRAPAGRSAPHVGYVPQLETVDWSFPVTVEEVVLLGRIRSSGLWPWPSGEDRRCARQVMEQLGIGALSRQHIRNLSGGQQQRVFLARALVAQPDLLVLDEPTNGVDARTADGVLHLLAGLNTRGMTILMTTHDLNAAAAHVPWAICLNHRLVAQGPPEEVFTDAILTETYEGPMLVMRQDGMLFVHQKPHGHSYREAVGGEPPSLSPSRFPE
jgi:zinc/manganese transport system ATP-binding protein/zinc transport system ATP-binding protein